MKPISTFIFGILFGLSAFAQPADSVIIEPQNLPLNEEGKADAYSWLSKDGLRIYFTRDNSDDEIWKAERKSLTEEFKNPESIAIKGIGGGNDVFSCWLTEDEKTLFFVTHEGKNGFSTTLYKSTFDPFNKEFINPININLNGGEISETSSIFISGPSLTADLKQLFVYYNDEHSLEQIAWFTTTDGATYNFKKIVNDGTNYCPGSLADNGLSFYLSLRDESNLLVKLTRPDLSSDFGNPQYFKIDKNINEGKNYYQPSVNTELGIISLTYGEGTWETNNLAIIKLPTERTQPEEKTNFEVAEIDSIESAEIEVTEDWAADTAIIFQNVWQFEDVEFLPSDSIAYVLAADCTFGYDDSELKFIAVSSTDDTLSFDTNDDLIIPVSYNQTSYFNAMPNPASSSFRIMYYLKTNKTERPIFEITNLSGQILKRFELESTSGNFEIDIMGLVEGLYLYKIRTSDFASPVKKLVVKR
ncbi:MAG: T9SS type A sorting domain-containing protein [Bacteroidia bacterium]